MIKNDRQYHVSRAKLERFQSAVRALERQGGSTNPADQVRAAGFRTMVAELEHELANYEQLQRGRIAQAGPRPIEDLPNALVEQRIAAGLTQRELAERLGLKEQQIQRYEATDYNGARLARVLEVIEAMPEFRVSGIVEPAATAGGYLPAPATAAVLTNVSAPPLAATALTAGNFRYFGNVAQPPEDFLAPIDRLPGGVFLFDPAAVTAMFSEADLPERRCAYFDAVLQHRQTPIPASGMFSFSPTNRVRVTHTQPISEAQLA